MKKFFTLILCLSLLCFSFFTHAQFSHLTKYQSVVRDASGNPLPNKTVSFRINILKNSPSGTSVYSEIHDLTTNSLGLAEFNIGNGTGKTGSFAIDWGEVDYYLKVELSIDGGAYTEMGTSIILSVPRAFYADNVGSIKPGQISDPEIQNKVRVINIPAASISIEPAGTKVTRDLYGLRFAAGYLSAASTAVAVPTDWDSTTGMVVEIYFCPTTNNSGNVSFFIRAMGRNPGDYLSDPGSTTSAAIPVSGNMKLYKQSFNIPFTSLTGKKMLHFYGIQRGGTGETFTDDVRLIMINILYQATR